MKNFLFTALLFALMLPASSVFAGEYTVRPFLLDHTAVPRDVITDTVLLTNDSPIRKYVIFATVNEISVDKEGEIKEFVSPVMTDRSVTLPSWIEVKRSRIEIPPGEQIEVPVTFRISPNAEPGTYHAFIGFVPAPNRPTAERIAMDGEADGVVVKITISDQREESMRISSFEVDRFVTGENNRSIDITLENKGDIASAPTGEIIFYDSRGVEITSVEVNQDGGTVVEPGGTATIHSQVPLGEGLGRFKANLTLDYGEKQTASLHDSTIFYIVPLHLLIIGLIFVIFGSLLVTFLFKRTFMSEEFHDGTDEVTMYIKEGHDADPYEHDIDLSKPKE